MSKIALSTKLIGWIYVSIFLSIGLIQCFGGKDIVEIGAESSNSTSASISENQLDSPDLDYPGAEQNYPMSCVPTGLSWSEETKADQYHLQFSTFKDFSSDILIDTVINSTSYDALPAMQEGITYYWRVSSINATEEGDFSTPYGFIFHPTGGLLETELSIVGPTGNIIDTQPEFTFTTEDADTATLQILDPGLPEASNVVYEVSVMDTTSYQVPAALSYQPYIWKYRVAKAGCTSIEITDSFTIYPVLKPTGLTASTAVHQCDPDEYTLTLSYGEGLGSNSYTIELLGNTSGYSTTFETANLSEDFSNLVDDTYSWRVRSSNTKGESDWVDGNDVTLSSDIGIPTFSGLQSSETSSCNSITLYWNDATDTEDPSSSIIYDIFEASSLGGQSFTTPTYSTLPGDTSFTITG